MQPDAELQRLIDDCYEAFSAYPRPRILHASPLRDPVAILKTLTSAPLRQLTSEQIGPYAGHALTTVGDVFDYKHFLPRILEQAVRERFWTGIDPPIIATKLGRAEWLQWPAAEQAAVRGVFAGACAQSFGEHPDDEECDSWLCSVAILDLDFTAALETWLATPSRNAALQLVDFVMGAAKFVFKGDAAERAYWSYVDEAKIHQIRQWLLGAPVNQLLLETSRWIDPPNEWKVDRALVSLASLGPPRLH